MNTPPLSEAPTVAASDPPAVRSATPASFRHYLLERRPDGSLWELGRGGMGVTYRAVDVNLHCPVALKIIGPQCFGGENSRRRFIREARLAAQIRHPNVAAIYHLETEGEEVFYSMEYVDGITAESWVKGRGPMPVELALDVVMQVARALTASDKLKLIHRDIKPSNIMLVADPADRARVIVKVIDFGLARLISAESPAAELTTCAFVGTPQYASPEQIDCLDLDVRSDIYSLGCVFWYLLTGEPPFTGSTARVMAQQLTMEPPGERLPEMPRSMRILLQRMLSKDPGNRPQTPVALHTEVSQCREGVTRKTSRRLDLPTRHRLAAWLRPKAKTKLAASLAISLALLVAVTWLTLAVGEEAGALLPVSSPPSAATGTPAPLAPTGMVEQTGSISTAAPIPDLPVNEESSVESPESSGRVQESPPEAVGSALQVAVEPASSASLRMPMESDSADVTDLDDPRKLSFRIDRSEPSDNADREPAKVTRKASSRTRKKERGTSSGSPLQRARRSIEGFVHHLF